MPRAAASNIRGVVFDAVGTLIHPRPAFAEVYEVAGRRHGLTVTRDDVLARFRGAFADEERADHDGRTSELRERQRWQAIVARVFPDAPTPAQLFDELWDHFAAPAHWSVDLDTPELLAQLQSRGLQVAIASNFDERLPGLCAAWPALAEVPLFVSSAVGFRKPDARFFAAVSAGMRLAPGELLMVGDDLRNDCQGATAAGWQALHLVRPDRGPAATVVGRAASAAGVCATIERLDGVLAWLQHGDRQAGSDVRGVSN